MDYCPEPIDTSGVTLDREILELTERLARSTHDNWARRRLADGWRYGPERNDARKEHPGLVPYEKLSESEKDYDRSTALETLKAILALGYQIAPGEPGSGGKREKPETAEIRRNGGNKRDRENAGSSRKAGVGRNAGNGC